ncbi:hypothetical protein SHELI_v1c06420 [Spiroplasma helicoides]|uniref:DUF2130 domain-containing protein n=1 Tax=Spiroplasma helicoides TaxID=216938 RepID=A0A1B3SKZ7_9MOLU|nr:DUF2130 domain-containing protein [Spiroplasma helicoides]AOG60593.1 hypothetical protein SHELI_v1c06420 [Spiroplasma helicoides]
MQLDFICPKCGNHINEEDFEQSEKSLNNLQEFLNSKKEEFKEILKKELYKSFEEAKRKDIELELSKQKESFNKQISNLEKEMQLLESKKELEINDINKKSEIEIAKLELKINDFNKNKESEIEKAKFSVKEEYQKLIESNLNKILELEKININLKANIDNIENLNKLDILREKENLRNEYENKLNMLNNQINELKEANLQFKVIQNKTKGENFEHDVEGELRKVFVNDIIEKITSQSKKADYLQTIKEENKVLGKIVYEVKNAEWSNSWEKKLIEDMTKEGSQYGILVATSFNDKYRGIPFKVSDFSSNIYLTDPDSFTFVGNIIRTLIITQARLEEKYGSNDNNEKIKRFIDWKNTTFNTISKLFEDQFKRIEDSENSISKKVDEIRIAREKIYSNWIKVVKNFIEALNI